MRTVHILKIPQPHETHDIGHISRVSQSSWPPQLHQHFPRECVCVGFNFQSPDSILRIVLRGALLSDIGH